MFFSYYSVPIISLFFCVYNISVLFIFAHFANSTSQFELQKAGAIKISVILHIHL